MIADTRTNAGLDNISTFRKLHVFESPGRHVMMVATAGNLSATQSVMHHVAHGFEHPLTDAKERLEDMTSMFAAAEHLGRAVKRVQQDNGGGAEQDGVAYNMSFLFGGQISGGPVQLFMIYAAGNFIECTQDAPFLQIGEHKYGKPILDRAVSFETDLYDALKIGLVSMDSTMRSNLGVGLPIDIALMRRDAHGLEVNTRIDGSDGYFHDLRDRWSAALRAAHMGIPRPPYGPNAP